MRAVRVMEPGVVALADVPEPGSPGDVLVRIDQVGICGTDVKILAGKIPVAYPRVMGHEAVGIVVASAAGGPFTAGDRVLIDPGVACGWCRLCRDGRPNICVNGGLLGRDVDGVFTELIDVPITRLVEIPESLPLREQGLLQVLGTCVHAVRQADIFPGRVAVVVGLGVTGQLIAQLLRLQGMTVVGVTRSEWKRQLASDLGAVATAAPDDAAALVADMTDGLGPQLVVEAVGTERTLASAIELSATGGQVLVFGTITGGDQGLPYYQLYHKELTLLNPRAARIGDYAEGVALTAAGLLRLDPIVSHQLPLQDAARAFELVEEPSAMKVLMTL